MTVNRVARAAGPPEGATDKGGTDLLAACGGTVVDPPLGEADAARLARLLAALADPVRLRLLSILQERGEACSCDLERPLGKSQPTISHHTKVLAAAGLVEGERRGRWTWWRIDPENATVVRRALGG